MLESLFNKVASFPTTLLKRDSNTDVFLWILRNFQKRLFLQNGWLLLRIAVTEYRVYYLLLRCIINSWCIPSNVALFFSTNEASFSFCLFLTLLFVFLVVLIATSLLGAWVFGMPLVAIFTYNSFISCLNPLSAKFIKWSNTLKQIVGKLPTICLSAFDHFSGLALKGLRLTSTYNTYSSCSFIFVFRKTINWNFVYSH